MFDLLRRTRVWIALGCMALLCAGPVHAKGKISSRWLDREIVVDGEIDEWRDALEYFGSVDTFVAMFNDEATLYVCLYTQNPALARELAVDGLRMRIEGKKTGEFVVNFPKGSIPERPQGPGRQVQRPPAATDVIELDLPGQKGRVAVTAGGEAGLEASVSHRNSFVYELKLPLLTGETRPWAPGLRPGEKFKLLIENPQLDAIAARTTAAEPPRSGASPFNPGASGPLGTGGQPGWGGGLDPNAAFDASRFAFLFKARVELARAP